jgi:hypothetical protein
MLLGTLGVGNGEETGFGLHLDGGIPESEERRFRRATLAVAISG